MSLQTIFDFLEPINLDEISNDEGYRNTQLGNHVITSHYDVEAIQSADIIIVGCAEYRGNFKDEKQNGPNEIRAAFYNLFHWHQQVTVADLGNIKIGATLSDTYAALRTVLQELQQQKKKVVVLGGSHDLTTAQYQSYVANQKIIDAVIVDAFIDLNMESRFPCDHFLMDMLTGEPNFLNHYNHIGFQSYFVHPTMLETIDKLRFDCYRVGVVKENMEEMEPVIRNTQMFSFDIAAIQNSHAPSNRLTPNGFNGEESCMLMQYAGMSATVDTIGIYGYLPSQDLHQLTAKQIAHMLWYLMDGVLKGQQEADFKESHQFNEYHLNFAEVETVFLQSKKTGRWWMQLPDKKFIACSQYDYITAASNDIPERWLRAAERS